MRLIYLFFIAFLLGFVAACKNEIELRDQNQRIGNDVILALNNFKEVTGEYPNLLDSLVPMYLSTIPTTIEGTPFIYKNDKLQGYYLCFETSESPKADCCYNRRFEAWECTSGD